MIRRHAHLVSLAALLVAFAAWVAPAARSDDPAPTQVLPDMRQKVPSDIKVAYLNGAWQIGFASEVANDGPGYLKITGNGPGNGPMVADQIVQMSDGSSTTVPGIGEMHYVVGGGHEHWHLLDFERYELRSTADPTLTIVRDQKTGFCLADAFTSDLCGRNHPELTTVSEGISVGGSDKYLGYLEGQSLIIDPATTPDGDYLLVNRVNPTGALLDANSSDDAASVRIHLAWGATGTPSLTVTNSCPASIDCPPPPPAPVPDPQPDPQPHGSPPSPPLEPVTPVLDPQPVPVVPASDFTRVTGASMSRSMAGRLVRRAIQRSTGQAPRGLHTSCERKSRFTFACSSSWRTRDDARWHGQIRVSYREGSGLLSWFYKVAARRSRDNKLVVTRSLLGSASAVFSGPGGALFCARLH